MKSNFFFDPTYARSGIKSDTITELTSGAGVTVGGLLIKDGGVRDDGWTPINETWTYASASTITVPTNATLRFQIGDKLRFTNSSLKYFYVIGVSATVLTVTAGSDYTVANTTFSGISVSRQKNPLNFPDFFNYAAVCTDFSAAPTNTMYRFSVDGRRCDVAVRQATPGTSNGANFTITAPITAATITNGYWTAISGPATNSGGTIVTPTLIAISTGAASFILYQNMTATWATTLGKRCDFNIWYEI